MPTTHPDRFEAFFIDSAECFELADELISNLEVIISDLSISDFEDCDNKSDLLPEDST